MNTQHVACNVCGEDAEIRPRALILHKQGGPAVSILNIPTIVCNHCGTKSYTETVTNAIDHLHKEVDRPHTGTATGDYAKAAEAWEASA